MPRTKHALSKVARLGTRYSAAAAAVTLIAGLAQAPHAAAVLVKGSRFMAMERVVQALQSEGARHAA